MTRAMRRPVGAALGALLLVATTAACGSGGGESEGDGSLSVWIMQGTNPDAEKFFDEVGTDFEEETGATLDVEFVEWADAHDRFVTSIAGGTTPDVAEIGTTWTPEFADAGALAPLDEHVESAGLSDDLVEGLVEAGTYDEQLYGMPWYAGVRSLVYNTEMFEKAGVEPPTTWAELEKAAAGLKKEYPDKIAVAVPGDAEFTVYPWVWGAGGEVATQDGDTWTSGLDSPEAQEGIEFWTGLATEGDYSSAGATTWRETDVLDAFAAGDVGMSIQGSWTPSAIVEANKDMEGKFAAVPIPGKDGGMAPSVAGGSHLSMFETTEDKDLAFQFIEMMTTGKYAQEWGEQSGYFPGQVSLLDKTLESTDPLVAPFAEQFVDGVSPPVAPTYGAVQAKATTSTMMQSILSGDSDVPTATKAAAEEMTTVLNGSE